MSFASGAIGAGDAVSPLAISHGKSKGRWETMKHRPGSWRLVAAAAAVAGALAVPGLPAAASAAAQAAPHSLTMAPYQAAGAASAACATSRPHTGKILYVGIKGGMSRLTIKSRLSHDSAIVLVRGRSKAIGVYVRAHASTTVRNIKSGTYTIYFTTGSLFRACKGRFSRGASYSRVKQHLPFAFPPHFTVATLILFVASGGGAPSTPISPRGFPAP